MKRKIPDPLWLQWPKHDDQDKVSWQDVTWCEDSTEASDVKYLRATPVREAAPELLAACKAIEFSSRMGELLPNAMEMVRNAIAKATAR